MIENKFNLVFVNFAPMSRIFGEKMSLSWFETYGFSVQLWDCSFLYYDKDQISAYFSGSDNLKYLFDPCFQFKTRSQVSVALERLPENTFIYHLTRQDKSLVDDFWFLKLLSLHNLPYAVQMLENPLLPIDESKRRIFEYLANCVTRLFSQHDLRHATVKLLNLVSLKLKGIAYRWSSVYAKPVLAFGVGRFGREAFSQLHVSGVNYVSVPSPIIMWSELKDEKRESPIVLFVDESIGHAPDAKLNRYSTSTDLEQYYRNLEHVFALLEKYTGYPVIIGASGKVTYYDNPFGREIVYKQTLKLSNRAVIVVGHASSALYQSFCAGKPILLLDDPTFSKEKTGHVKTFAAGVGLPYFDSTLLDNSVLDSLCKQGNNEKLIEHLFKEKGVEGDYRQLIADAIIAFMEMRAEANVD